MGYVCIANLPQGKGVGGFFSNQARTGAGLREALSLPRNITTRDLTCDVPSLLTTRDLTCDDPCLTLLRTSLVHSLFRISCINQAFSNYVSYNRCARHNHAGKRFS